MPLPVLPLALPNLAPYLQAALEESQRCSDSRARLSKLVNATTQAAMTAQSHSSVPQVIAPMLSTIAPNERTRMGQEPVRIQQENSSGSKGGFFSRVFKPKGSNHKGKGLNDGMYDIGMFLNLIVIRIDANRSLQSHHTIWSTSSFCHIGFRICIFTW